MEILGALLHLAGVPTASYAAAWQHWRASRAVKRAEMARTRELVAVAMRRRRAQRRGWIG